MGMRMVDEFFAKSKTPRCRTFKDTAETIAGVRAVTVAVSLPRAAPRTVACLAVWLMRFGARWRSPVQVLVLRRGGGNQRLHVHCSKALVL